MGKRTTRLSQIASELDALRRDAKDDREAMQRVFDRVRTEMIGRKEAQDASERWMKWSAQNERGGSIRRWATFREFIRLWRR